MKTFKEGFKEDCEELIEWIRDIERPVIYKVASASVVTIVLLIMLVSCGAKGCKSLNEVSDRREKETIALVKKYVTDTGIDKGSVITFVLNGEKALVLDIRTSYHEISKIKVKTAKGSTKYVYPAEVKLFEEKEEKEE